MEYPENVPSPFYGNIFTHQSHKNYVLPYRFQNSIAPKFERFDIGNFTTLDRSSGPRESEYSSAQILPHTALSNTAHDLASLVNNTCSLSSVYII